MMLSIRMHPAPVARPQVFLQQQLPRMARSPTHSVTGAFF